MIKYVSVYSAHVGLNLLNDNTKGIQTLNDQKLLSESTSGLIAQLKKSFEGFDLGQIEERYQMIENFGRTQSAAVVADQLRSLRAIIEHELISQSCFVVDRDSASIVDHNRSSEAARQAIPVAVYHYERGLSAYSFGFHTGCMFHCMRAGGEILPWLAPRLLGRRGIQLGVNLYDNWGMVIDHLASKRRELDIRNKRNDPVLLRQLQDFSQVLDRMYALKSAWRDRIMHEINDVAQQDAKDAILSMRAFIEEVVLVFGKVI